jgi:hypothetical protein
MKVKKGNIRKDVELTELSVKALQAQADRKGFSLKKWMEIILVKQSEKS